MVIQFGGIFMENWLLISDLAAELDIAETTARRWARLFESFLPAKKFNRVTRYGPETVAIFTEIASLYKKGFTTEEIRHHLQQERPQALVVAPEEEQALVLSRQRAIVALERLANVMQVLADQKEDLRRIDDKTRDLEDKDQQREKELEYVLHRLDYLEREAIKRPWWKRLF